MNPASVSQVLGELNGSPRYLGTLAVTTTGQASNFSNAPRFGPGAQLLVQADAACFILGGTSGTANITTGNGVALQAGQTFYIRLRSPKFGVGLAGETHIQAITATGTANLKVWMME